MKLLAHNAISLVIGLCAASAFGGGRLNQSAVLAFIIGTAATRLALGLRDERRRQDGRP